MKKNNNISFAFGILGVLFFIVSTILAGLQVAGYSHIAQLISESYAIDTPYGLQLRMFGFLPSGFFIAAFSFLAVRILPKSKLTTFGLLGIGIFYGIATVIVSIFPCDKGCNKELIDPSLSQLVHNLSGMLTYLIVPVCLILIGIAARNFKNGNRLSFLSFICGGVSILFVGILSSNMDSAFAGLLQRIIEGAILSWIMICSFYIRSLNKIQE